MDPTLFLDRIPHSNVFLHFFLLAWLCFLGKQAFNFPLVEVTPLAGIDPGAWASTQTDDGFEHLPHETAQLYLTRTWLAFAL